MGLRRSVSRISDASPRADLAFLFNGPLASVSPRWKFLLLPYGRIHGPAVIIPNLPLAYLFGPAVKKSWLGRPLLPESPN